ncbi:hypothetical protein DFH08DRAFT_853317 [Mycena albidolilacea]|uniref:Uncharacterized protein n=1 Tax=Mycena albidolilacea TaxID=1033008 RepID=A0AAD7EX02_9AGAR|nr:hypothetical protein DFH08DRAFT_853317 [Mycena albidolilacea]
MRIRLESGLIQLVYFHLATYLSGATSNSYISSCPYYKPWKVRLALPSLSSALKRRMTLISTFSARNETYMSF